MKLENLPDFAKPYKKRGYDVREQNGTYFLYKITSKRMPDKNYPVLVQDYIGVIAPDGSLTRKKEYPDKKGHIYLEYGLSSFIKRKHGRALQRSLFNSSDDKGQSLVALAIIKYVFGCLSEVAINSCYLAKDNKAELVELGSRTGGEKIDRLVKKIDAEQKLLLGEDKLDAEILLRLCVMEKGSLVEPDYSPGALRLLEKHGIEL